MSSLDKEPTSGGIPLPIVSEELLYATQAEFTDDPRRVDAVFRQMYDENPALADGLGRVVHALAGDDPDQIRTLLAPATIVYNCLRSQAEADTMNGYFDSPESEDPSK